MGYSSVRSHGRYRVVEVFSVRNEDGSSGSLSLLHGLCYVLEDGQSKVLSARLLGVCASNNLCACRPVSPSPSQVYVIGFDGRIPYSIACCAWKLFLH